jgi:GNAT superfamily N-acetyltransferase
MSEATLRPLTGDDVVEADKVSQEAFAALERRLDADVDDPRANEEWVAWRRRRMRHLLAHDPDGAVVAVEGDRIVGVALALRRERLWGLSLLTVDPGSQSAGVGKRLLEYTLAYASGCDIGIIAASPDPRAIRRYARAGFALRPALEATGAVRREALTATPRVRDGGSDDLEFAADVDRKVRGAPHAVDLEMMLGSGSSRLLIAPGGYAVAAGNRLVMLAATDVPAARELLIAALADLDRDEPAIVSWLMQGHDWAFEILLDAGLALSPTGPFCTRGAIGDLTCYLPSGAFL